MPTFRFHAVDADASAILDFVFRELRCRVVDAYSRYDAPIAEYQDSASALAAYPAPPSSAARFIHLKVWRPDFGGEIRVRKIDFRPGAVPGHSFWHVSEGWGLIDLQIARRHDTALGLSSIAVNSEARARMWQDTLGAQLGSPLAWHWPIVESTTRRLQYHIGKRLAIGKHNGRPILPGAHAARSAGITLAEF